MNKAKQAIIADCIMKIAEQLDMIKYISDSDTVDDNCRIILVDVNNVLLARPEIVIDESDFEMEDTENPVDLEEPSIAEIIIKAASELDDKVDYQPDITLAHTGEVTE